MSKRELDEARMLLEKAQKLVPWCVTISVALGTVLPVAVLGRSAVGIGFGLAIGLSMGLGLSSAALAVTNSIIAILKHLSENNLNESQ